MGFRHSGLACASGRRGTIDGPPNKGLQLTKAARCAPFGFRSWGQSLRAAFAAEARCSLYQARSPIEITTARIGWTRQS